MPLGFTIRLHFLQMVDLPGLDHQHFEMLSTTVEGIGYPWSLICGYSKHPGTDQDVFATEAGKSSVVHIGAPHYLNPVNSQTPFHRTGSRTCLRPVRRHPSIVFQSYKDNITTIFKPH